MIKKCKNKRQMERNKREEGGGGASEEEGTKEMSIKPKN